MDWCLQRAGKIVIRRVSGGIRGGQRLAWLMLLGVGACGAVPGTPLPEESTAPIDATRFQLVTRFAHISDAQVVDEESPARFTAFAGVSLSAWRPYEAYSTQLLDGAIRAINKLHATGLAIDFVVHTGDAIDNSQRNELGWFLTCMNGGRVDPRSGPDDRAPAARPDPLLDPHHPFDAQGLYRQGMHGALPTIGWYSLVGNHDHFAVGVLPIVTQFNGTRVSPVPLQPRLGLFLPTTLDPTGSVAWGAITPARPGPPNTSIPTTIQPNAARAYLTNREFVEAHVRSGGEPMGHGFDAAHPERTWYSVTPVPGLRLIGLDSASPIIEQPTLAYVEGAISLDQAGFLRNELRRAAAADEMVIVATHHPSGSLLATLGTAFTTDTLVALLNRHPSVRLHLAGHWHTHAVINRGGYAEMVTASLLDAPQQGRIVEIWRDGDEVELRYRFFSHLDDVQPPDDAPAELFADPLLPLRRRAAELAGAAR